MPYVYILMLTRTFAGVIFMTNITNMYYYPIITSISYFNPFGFINITNIHYHPIITFIHYFTILFYYILTQLYTIKSRNLFHWHDLFSRYTHINLLYPSISILICKRIYRYEQLFR